jgi:hypothetical protein
VAAQASLPAAPGIVRRQIHGGQMIGEIPRGDVPFKASGVYISALRVSERMSSLSLNRFQVLSNDRNA